jgi:hypothetical protein
MGTNQYSRAAIQPYTSVTTFIKSSHLQYIESIQWHGSYKHASQKEKPIMQIDQCKVGKSKTRNDVCHRHSQFFFLAAVDTVTQAWYI